MKKYIVLSALVLIALFFCIGMGSSPSVRATGDITETTLTTEPVDTPTEELTTTAALDVEQELTDAYNKILVIVTGALSGILGTGVLGLLVEWFLKKTKAKLNARIDALTAQNKISAEQAAQYKAELDATQAKLVETAKYYEGKIAEFIGNQNHTAVAVETLTTTVETLISKVELRDERINALLDEELAKNDA